MAALSAAEITTVLDTWPSDDADLPTTVKSAVDAWKDQRMPAINLAITALNDDPNTGFTTPSRNGFHKAHKCRTLAVHMVAATAGGPTPLPAELRSMLPSVDDVPDAVSSKIRLLETQLAQQRDTVAALVRQQAAIDAERDVTADYEIHETVLGSLPASFLEHDPLSKKDRRTILQDHQGKCPEGKYPNKLALKESTRNSKVMQKAAKLTLPQYAGEVCKFLERNDFTTKMAGTAWSRLLDMQEDLGNSLTSDPDAWYRADEILDQINEIAHCAQGAFVFGLDQSVMMRLNVSNRIDVAMGIKHLRVDPFKRETDDFISSDTYKLVKKKRKKSRT